MRDKLKDMLAQLRFHGIAAALDAEIERAEREATPASELLYRLLCQEAASRRQRSLAYRLDQAKLPWRWTLDSFPFDRQPGVNKAQIKNLAELKFLRRADNVLLIGPPGTGKTGLALGLLREACCPEPRSTGRKFCGDSLCRSSLWRGSQGPRETRLDEAGRKDVVGGLMPTEIFQNGPDQTSDIDRQESRRDRSHCEIERRQPAAQTPTSRAQAGRRRRTKPRGRNPKRRAR